VIGGDLLRNYDVDLDFGAGKMNLLSRDHCADKVVYWPSSTLAKLPMRVSDNNQIVFSMLLDGHEVSTVLDTGASQTALEYEAATEIFDLKADSPGVEAVPTGDGRVLHYKHFATLAADGLTIANPRIKLLPDPAGRLPGVITRGRGKFIARMHRISQSDLRLGMSTLKQLHIYIDYRNQTLYMTSVNDTGAPAAKP
jgi:hypothetical protein